MDVKLPPCLTRYHAMKTYSGVEALLHAFLTAALDVDEWLVSRAGYSRKETPGTH
jgi:hypothetical protein